MKAKLLKALDNVYLDESDISKALTLSECGFENREIIEHLNNLQQWQLRDFLCDLCELSHHATNEEIINKINSKLNGNKK